MATEKVRVNNEWVDVKDNGIGSQIEKSMTTATTISNSFTNITDVAADPNATYIITARVEYKYTQSKSAESLDLFRLVAFDSNNNKSGKCARTFAYPINSTATLYMAWTAVCTGYPKYGIDGAASTGNSIVGAYLTLTKIA